MKYRIYVAAALLCLLSAGCDDSLYMPDDQRVTIDIEVPEVDGMTVSGVIIDKSTKEPISGVVVSDGKLCTQTDENGIYYLPTDLATQRVLTVSIPSGYEIPLNTTGNFAGYKFINTGKSSYKINFALSKRAVSDEEFDIIFSGDPQIADRGTYIATWDYLAGQMAAYARNVTKPTYVIQLGDLVYNDMTLFQTYKMGVQKYNLPTFNVIGNHDHNPDVIGEYEATEAYTSEMGPRNYSVNIGNIHFIFLDSIIWSEDKKYSYKPGFDEEAITFLKNDLAYVSKDTPVHICTHAPVTRYPTSGHKFTQQNNIEFLKALDGYDVKCWNGHYHITRFYSYNATDLSEVQAAIQSAATGTDGAAGSTENGGTGSIKSLETCIVSRCTGALESNIEIDNDGVPRGFVVAEVNGKDMTWTYNSVEDEDNPQMYIYTPDMTGIEGTVYANVFMYDANSWGRVEWWEDNTFVCAMEYDQVGKDPYYAKLHAKYAAEGRSGSGPGKGDNTHLFKVTPSISAVQGEVRVKDRFGRQWKRSVTLK